MEAAPALAQQVQIDRGVVQAALSRAVLVARAAVTITAACAGLLIVANPWQLIGLVIAVVIVTLAEVAVLTRWPAVVSRPIAITVVDSAGLVVALALAGPGLAYFCYAAGCAALAGTLLGLRALPFWAAQAVLGFAVADRFLEATQPVSDVAVFVLAIPPATILAGIGLAGVRNMVSGHVDRTVHLVALAQRSAVASERSRLARELHDSVAKTLRGVSFAALALPASMRRHPALAEQLASTVSLGAEEAVNQARELMVGLRLDDPEQDFSQTLAGICREWTTSTGIDVRLLLEPVEPPIAIRYHLTRILHEALVNVEQHAHADRVTVELTRSRHDLHLSISDDGKGLPQKIPGPASGHFGLVGMSERARAIGGTLRLGSNDAGGATITVSIPLDAQATGEVPHDRHSDRRRQSDRSGGAAWLPRQHRRDARHRRGE
jgi:signal transduction histidine kinase